MGKYDNKIDLSQSEAEVAARMESAAQRRIVAGREFFIRECLKEGIDPSKGVSPSLLKALGVRHASNR